MAKVKKKLSRKSTLERSKDVPVTREILLSVRDEINETIERKFNTVKSAVHELKAEVHEMKSEIHEVKADIHAVRADVHQIKLLVEDQNARNRIVLDGLTSLFSRQDRVERELEDCVRK